MSGKFRAITQIFLIPLGPWNKTKIKVLHVRILCMQIVPLSFIFKKMERGTGVSEYKRDVLLSSIHSTFEKK